MYENEEAYRVVCWEKPDAEDAVEPLMGLQDLISLGGDEGEIYEFLLNMSYPELEKKLELMYKKKAKEAKAR